MSIFENRVGFGLATILAICLVWPSHGLPKQPKQGPEEKIDWRYVPNYEMGRHFEGDIELDDEQLKQGIDFNHNPAAKWASKEIPYQIGESITSDNAELIEAAVAKWNEVVKCIKWVPISTESDYVTFMNDEDGCYTNAGHRAGETKVHLASGCMRQGTILHEMNHVTGSKHEQSRSDRDTYIEMLWQNIPKDWQAQYSKTDPYWYGLQGDYDYYSVMHYGIMAPPKNTKPAYKVLQDGIDESQIGQRKGFTPTDLAKISKQYCD